MTLRVIRTVQPKQETTLGKGYRMAAIAIDWSDILKGIPAGAWVAVEQCRVIAYGADMQRVLAEAREKGVREPLMIKVPNKQENLFL